MGLADVRRRGCLGQPVTLENIDVKVLVEGPGEVVGQFLGTGHDQIERPQFPGLRFL